MAAAEFDGSWVDLQRQREQRMRFEVLDLLFRLSGGQADVLVHAMELGAELGVWKDEVYRIVDWLDRHDFVRGWGSGPNVAITERGARHIREWSGGERSIRDLA